MRQKKPLETPPEPIEILQDETMETRRPWRYIVGGLILVVVLLLGVVAFRTPTGGGVFDPSDGKHLPTVTPTPTPKTIYTVMMLGGGGAGHQGGELTDTMMLVRADTVKKEIQLVNVPRDIWVNIKMKGTEKTEDKKINFAFYAGGPDEMKRVIEMVTGVSVDYYVFADFSGFTKIIDLLGGIDVEVPVSFVDNLYPVAGKEDESCGKSDEEIKQVTATLSGLLVDQQFLCRYERIEFTKGKTFMDGATALKFVRSRHSTVGGGDFARAQRQQAVVEAVRSKVLSVWSLPKIPSLVSTTMSYIHTDIRREDVSPLITRLPDAGSYTIKRIILSTDTILSEGTSSDKQYILLPKAGMGKWESVRAYVQDAIGK